MLEPTNRPWWSVSEIAKRWSVHRATVFRLVQAGRLRASDFGLGSSRGTWRVSHEDLLDYERSLSKASGGPSSPGAPLKNRAPGSSE